MINIYIHPGYPKTGTTFLQKRIFSQLKKFIIVKKPRSNNYNPNELYDKLFKSDFYSKEKSTFNLILYRDQFVNLILKEIKKNIKKDILISDEGLLDPFGSPGLINIYLLKDIVDRIREKTKLKINVKFIITIRSYEELIYSYFAFRNHIFSEDINYYLKKRSFLDNFNYYKFHEEISRQFDSEMLFLELELLETNPSKYIKKIEKFMNIKININKINFHKRENSNSSLEKNKKIFYVKKNLFSRSLLVKFFNLIVFLNEKIKYRKKLVLSNKEKKSIKSYFKKSDKRFKKLLK